MRKFFIRILYTVLVFLAALVFFEARQGQEPSNMTGELAAASLPVIRMEAGDTAVNLLYGNTAGRDLTGYRAVITPIGEDRNVTFTVDPCGQKVSDLSFEVRSADGKNLIENRAVTGEETTAEDDGTIRCSVTLQNLIAEKTDYMLVFILSDGSGEGVRYYTRIRQEESPETTGEELTFVRQFHDAALNGSNDALLKQCLEPDGGAANADLGYVTIHSALDQVKYGTLSLSEASEPLLSVTDLQSETAMFRVDSVLTGQVNGKTAYFDCTEYFRIRAGTDRIYLLDYARTMDEVFDPADDTRFTDDVISLGITGSTPQIVESPGGSAFAFTKAGRLFVCTTADDAIAAVCAFAAPESVDVRENHREYGIRILNVDETGNVDFLVYGYINRGVHEGETGTMVLQYSNVYHTVEEKAFFSYPGSADILAKQVEALSYYSKSGILYLLVDGSVYAADLQNRSVTAIETDLSSGSYVVSDSGRMLAVEDREEGCIRLYDFTGSGARVLQAETGTIAVPVCFINEDLVYGLVRKDDLRLSASGTEITPMYSVRIVDADLNELENYEKAGFYVSGGETDGEQLTLHRLAKDDAAGFREADDDEIMYSGSTKDTRNQLRTVATEAYETVTEIDVRGFGSGKITVIDPRVVLYDGSREMEFPEKGEKREQYYVVDMTGTESMTGNPGEAVREAGERGGNVIDENGETVWLKGNRLPSNQIMAIDGEGLDDTKDSRVVCLTAVLRFESAAASAETLLTDNGSIRAALGKALPDARIMDLTGCPLDAVLYYVNVEKPVFATSGVSGETMLIVGYNDNIVVLLDPLAGELRRVQRSEAERLFTGDGSGYLVYLRR